MSFISFSFLAFFVIVSALWFVLKKAGSPDVFSGKVNLSQLLIFISSLIFYAFGGIKFIPLILFTVALTYGGAILFEKKSCGKFIFFAVILLDLIPLLFFKYSSFVSEKFFSKQLSFVFPLGLSFYTFQSIGYLSDVYKKKISPEKNFLTVASFITFFPCVTSGPIQRSEKLIPQLKNPRAFDYDFSSDGLKLFAWGLFKKFMIADQLAVYVNFIYGNIDLAHGCAVLLAVILYSFQIYCDFSGYTDMAAGLARFLGFDVGINFDHPYLSKSVGEFWRKWHISLSSWLRDYIYIPLGGSRVALPRIYFNLLVTFFVSGIWHGSTLNFLLWGLSYGLILCLERATKDLRAKIKSYLKISDDSRFFNFLSIFVTFVIVTLLWILFRAENLSMVAKIFKKFSQIPLELLMFFTPPTPGHIKSSLMKFTDIKLLTEPLFVKNAILMFLGFICITLLTQKESGLSRIRRMSFVKRWLLYIVFVLAIVMHFLLNSTQSSEFIYKNF